MHSSAAAGLVTAYGYPLHQELGEGAAFCKRLFGVLLHLREVLSEGHERSLGVLGYLILLLLGKVTLHRGN